MAETYYIRFMDGPLEGTRPVAADRIPWPPPEIDDYPDFGGRYVRVRMSQLDGGASPHLARGAEYRWEPVR